MKGSSWIGVVKMRGRRVGVHTIVRNRVLGLLIMLFLPFAVIISSVPHTVWGQNREYPFADGSDSWGMGLLSLPCMLMCELSQMRMASMCYCCVITICGTTICGIFSCVHICSWNSNTQRYFSYYIMCFFFLKKTRKSCFTFGSSIIQT